MTWSLLHGDCLDVLSTLDEGCCSALVMDPPFTAAGGSTNGRSGGFHNADDQFFEHWLRDVMTEIQRVVRPDGCGFIFCDWRTLEVVRRAVRGRRGVQTAKVWEVTQAVVWDRESFGLGSPLRNQFEMIAFARGPQFDRGDRPRNIANVMRHRWPYGAHALHPAEKPVPLLRDLVRIATWGDDTARVLDPFAGSGTTGVACAGEGRGFLGVEVSDDDHATASARVAAAYGSPPAERAPLRPQSGLFAGVP